MPDRGLERWLRRLLPPGARDPLFDTARYDLEPERLLQNRSRWWYRRQVVRLFAKCWRVHSTSEFSWPAPERTAVFLNDLRFALRGLIREPGFAVAAILTLALGVGANVAVFAMVEAVLLRPLPYADAGRLTILRHRNKRTGVTKEFIAIGDYVDLAQRQTSFESICGYGEAHPTIVDNGEPFRAQALVATPGFLETLRVAPILGRTIQASDARPNAARVALVSYEFWQSRLGADPKVLGREIHLDRGSLQVIGVLPPGFAFPPDTHPALVAPMATPIQPPASRKNDWTFAIARLKSGISLEQAGAALTQLSQRLEQEYADNQGQEYYAVPLRDELAGDSKPALLIGLGAVSFVLLIACANVANLLLARSVGRRREMAVRMALGAGFGRIGAQLLTESLTLGAVAGLTGTLMARWAAHALAGAIPKSLAVSGLGDAGMDGAVLGFAVGISTLTAMACGWISAMSVRTTSASGTLISTTRVTAGRSLRRSAGALVVAEVSLAIVLLMGAGLLLRTFAKLVTLDPGFQAAHVAAVSASVPASHYRDAASRRALFTRVMAELKSVPGIQEAGTAVVVPLTGNNWTTTFDRADRPAPEGERPPEVGWQKASGGYFRALSIPLRSGRLFDERDATGPPVVIVSEGLERRYYPNERAVGHAVRIDGRAMEIVGVVGDIRRADLRNEPRPDLYFPMESDPATQSTWFVRSTGDPSAAMAATAARLRFIEPGTVLLETRSMEQIAADSLRATRLSMWLVGVFAAIALVLAAIGIYGVMSYVVRQRTREIGTRVALGATATDIVWMMMRQGAGMATVGAAIGIGLGAMATRALGSALYGVSPTDPLTLAGATGFLIAAALLASYLPARRAARVDPARTLAEG